MKYVALLLTILFTGSLANAEQPKRRPLISFTIDKYNTQGEVECRQFKLSRPDVARYLRTVKTARLRFFTEELYSPCKVSGTVVFSGNDEGTYVIHSSGIGALSTSQRGSRIVFAQPKWNDPYIGGYFNNGD